MSQEVQFEYSHSCMPSQFIVFNCTIMIFKASSCLLPLVTVTCHFIWPLTQIYHHTETYRYTLFLTTEMILSKHKTKQRQKTWDIKRVIKPRPKLYGIKNAVKQLFCCNTL